MDHKHGPAAGCQYKYTLAASNEFYGHFVSGPAPIEIIGVDENGPILSRPTAEFIAHARQDVPALCEEVRRLQALLAVGGAA